VEDELLVPKIRSIHEGSKRTYGPKRIKAALETESDKAWYGDITQ
jgi:hypothetical protein